jgi:peptidoglycan/LPS O-acetylase OafA/YrhL
MKDNARTVIAVGLGVVVGGLALPFVFSDLSSAERIAERVAIAASIFFLGGALVGWVAVRRWPLSALCAWPPLGMGLVMLISKVTVQGEVPPWPTIGAFLLVPLAVAVFGGYAGYRLGSRISSR